MPPRTQMVKVMMYNITSLDEPSEREVSSPQVYK